SAVVGRVAVLADEGSVASLREKPRVDEGPKHSFARRFVQSPQPAGLLGGQPQARHFKEFAADAADYVLYPKVVVAHSSSDNSIGVPSRVLDRFVAITAVCALVAYVALYWTS